MGYDAHLFFKHLHTFVSQVSFREQPLHLLTQSTVYDQAKFPLVSIFSTLVILIKFAHLQSNEYLQTVKQPTKQRRVLVLLAMGEINC